MILADTGFFVALVISSDRHHAAAVDALGRYSSEGLLTTWPVLTESTHLMLREGGTQVTKAFVDSVRAGAAQIFDLRARHLQRVVDLMEKYQQLPMDLADASLIIAAEEADDGRILSTDARDFGAYRFKRRKPFKNLMTAPSRS
ncbi:MAG: PIN domain-containing protein [Myxococcales bacterium]|nr:PIN domain-containing protein [Myxococcales bacterium]MDD9971399.1 PIN domain-containing protein [Myxococcales bacterium]